MIVSDYHLNVARKKRLDESGTVQRPGVRATSSEISRRFLGRDEWV